MTWRISSLIDAAITAWAPAWVHWTLLTEHLEFIRFIQGCSWTMFVAGSRCKIVASDDITRVDRVGKPKRGLWITDLLWSTEDCAQKAKDSTVVSKSVANPWRDPKIAVLAGQKAVKKWIRQMRGK
jgi:hypothetical protein